MKAEVCQAMFSAHIQSNAPDVTGQCFMKMDKQNVRTTNKSFFRKSSATLHNGQVSSQKGI